MEGKSTGGAMIKNGGDTWYFITPNYAVGIAYQRDTTKFIEAAGGKVVGSHLYPFPEATDFSAALIEAQTSGAKVLGIGGAGADLINIVKQGREFSIPKKMKMAAGLKMHLIYLFEAKQPSESKHEWDTYGVPVAFRRWPPAPCLPSWVFGSSRSAIPQYDVDGITVNLIETGKQMRIHLQSHTGFAIRPPSFERSKWHRH
jgi:hypothetical protein